MVHIRCRFSVDEIASALVTHSAVEMRIKGAKNPIKAEKLFDVTALAEFSSRLPAVHSALYLLFDEGYQRANAEFAVRSEHCRKPCA